MFEQYFYIYLTSTKNLKRISQNKFLQKCMCSICHVYSFKKNKKILKSSCFRKVFFENIKPKVVIFSILYSFHLLYSVSSENRSLCSQAFSKLL